MTGAASPKDPFELKTWPELARLAEDVPEAGIHFQGEDSIQSLSPFATDRAIAVIEIAYTIRELKMSALPKESG